jgi:hypothetical protein
MLGMAFKEWAVICAALARGRQALILRKGGIAEDGGAFRPEFPEFVLFPTYFHEHRNGIKPEALPLLAETEAAKPPAGALRLSHFVRVEAVAHVGTLETAMNLDALHVWTPAVVEQRFHYRAPGLFALAVRAFALPQVADTDDKLEYAGCRTWVPLAAPLSPASAEPVLSDDAFAKQMAAFRAITGCA